MKEHIIIIIISSSSSSITYHSRPDITVLADWA